MYWGLGLGKVLVTREHPDEPASEKALWSVQGLEQLACAQFALDINCVSLIYRLPATMG